MKQSLFAKDSPFVLIVDDGGVRSRPCQPLLTLNPGEPLSAVRPSHLQPEFCLAFKPPGRRSCIAAASHGASGAARAGAAPASSRQADAEAPSSRRAGARAAQPPREACGPSPRALLAPGVFCAAGCPPGAPVARLTPELSCAAGSTARRRQRRWQHSRGALSPGPSPRGLLSLLAPQAARSPPAPRA